MDEKPNSLWKRAWHSRRWFRAWLISAAVTSVVVAIFWGNLGVDVKFWSDWPLVLAAVFIASMIMLIAAVPVALWIFLRWLCCWRNCKRFLLGCAALAALIVLFYAEEDWRGWHAWNQFKTEWEAKGEKFDFKDFVPPPVPDEQNFAMTLVVASCYERVLDKNGNRVLPQNINVVNRLAMNIYRENEDSDTKPSSGSWQKAQICDLKNWQEYYRHPKTNSANRNAAMTNEFPVAPQPQAPAADVLLALSKYDSVIEELRQASQRPYAWFPIDYDNKCTAAILLPHLSSLKNCSRVLQLRALANLEEGQSTKALADVNLSLYLANSMRTEPFLISHLVRVAMFQITLQPVYEGLAKHQWSEEQLAALDAELAKLDFLADCKFAMRGERASHNALIDYVRHAHEKSESGSILGFAAFSSWQFDYEEDSSFWTRLPRILEGLSLAVGPSGWYNQTKLRLSRDTQNSLNLLDDKAKIFPPNALQKADEISASEMKRWNPCNILVRLLSSGSETLSRKFALAQTSVDLARTAIALERYQLARGNYPESLDALAPQFIAKVPHDVIGGQPLKYRREADGQFVLYSVGWNEKDDGGVVVIPKGSSQPKLDEGDWVWRYPQK